jgi:hypothetical protein
MKLNLIECILNNKFLNTLYPEDILTPVYLAHLGLNRNSDFSLDVHVNQQPCREVSKMGSMGERL